MIWFFLTNSCNPIEFAPSLSSTLSTVFLFTNFFNWLGKNGKCGGEQERAGAAFNFHYKTISWCSCVRCPTHQSVLLTVLFHSKILIDIINNPLENCFQYFSLRFFLLGFCSPLLTLFQQARFSLFFAEFYFCNCFIVKIHQFYLRVNMCVCVYFFYQVLTNTHTYTSTHTHIEIFINYRFFCSSKERKKTPLKCQFVKNQCWPNFSVLTEMRCRSREEAI